MAEAMGYACLMTINGTYVEFISTDLNEKIDIIQDEGIRGSRSRVLERLAQGLKHVSGSINFEPTPVELALLLPLCTGSSSTATTLTDALSDITIILDTKTKKYTFLGRISALHFSAEPGGKVRMKADVIGKSCTVAATSLTGTPADITVRPYVMSDLGSTISLGGSTYAIDKLELSIDNRIEPTFMSGQVATDLEPTDRIVMLSVQLKYNSTEDALLVTAQAGPVIASPFTGSVAFTNGSNSATFAFGALVAASETVKVPNKKHLRLPLRYQAYRVGSTLEVVSTLV